MKVCLSLDDFSIVNNRLDLLLKLKEYFKDFKVSLFTIPIDKKEDWGPSLIRDTFLKDVKNHLNWIQIIPHGLHHDGSEVRDWNYDHMKERVLPAIKEAFDKDGLPFVKGFKAPHWRWNSAVVQALDDEGWWGAVDPRQPNMFCTKKFYRYTHAINSFPLEGDLKLHGHIYGTQNDLGRCMDNLLKLPLDTEWYFCTDLLETK